MAERPISIKIKEQTDRLYVSIFLEPKGTLFDELEFDGSVGNEEISVKLMEIADKCLVNPMLEKEDREDLFTAYSFASRAVGE